MAQFQRLKDARNVRFYEAGGRTISDPITVCIEYAQIRPLPR
jgi:hypothetical protein